MLRHSIWRQPTAEIRKMDKHNKLKSLKNQSHCNRVVRCGSDEVLQQVVIGGTTVADCYRMLAVCNLQTATHCAGLTRAA